ncbi:MAG: NAD-dependent epimerase/dehydratase family protein [Chloroflexi bacterium]|nr:NAD-dependent epimerase/dehydratase family protein [Chloroflexota bacterium]
MNVLITGGFGNIGALVVEECLRRGHAVSVFEVPNKRTQRLARRYARRQVRVLFGDLRNAQDVSQAVAGQDVVIHLAAILPPVSDARPDLCRAVNVGGTANLVAALQASPAQPALVSVSSACVMGPTQRSVPPVRPDDPLAPTDTYSRTKIEAEALVAASGLRYAVLRLAAVLPTVLNPASLFAMVKLIFAMPLEARCEIVVDLDVAHALASAAEDLLGAGELAGSKGFIAGGRAQGCQMRTRDLVEIVFRPLGLRLPNASLFAQELDAYYLDWYNTEQTQAVLRYQRHSAQEWQTTLLGLVRYARPLLWLYGWIIVKWIEAQSPLYPVQAERSRRAFRQKLQDFFRVQG